MRLPCEIVVRELLPMVRSLIAKQLVEEHGFTQTTSALLLGVSQASINYYLESKRGHHDGLTIEAENIAKTADEIATGLAEGKLSEVEVLTKICAMCMHLREHGEICQMHEKMLPSIKGKDCTACHVSH